MVSDSVRIPLSNTLTCAAVGQAMMVCGSFLARTVADLPAQQLDGISLATFYGTFAAGAGVSWWGAQRLRSGAKATARAGNPGQVPMPDAASGAPMAAPFADAYPTEDLPSDPFIARLQEVSEGQNIMITHPLTQDESGQYTSFRVRATKPGLFADERTRNKIYTRLTKAVDGYWNLTADTKADTLTFTRKAGFPSVVTPPVPTKIPQSPFEARDLYPDFRMRLGVTSDGTILEIDLAKLPHALFIGGTGSGKSVFARAVIEHFRTGGWMLFLGDGKGTDYEGLHRQPGIVAISQTTADHVRMVRMVADELKGRQADAIKRKRKIAKLLQEADGDPIKIAAIDLDPFQRPPLLLLLDEYATMLAHINTKYGRETFEQDLLFITRVGREFKVHLILSTQEAYRTTIPGTLLGNLSLRVSLGPPEDKTITEVFPLALQRDATRIGGTIKKSDRGRGLALMSDEEGNNSAIEFQSFYAYSPGESKPPANPEVAAEWARYKSMASDRMRPLYPRLWFKVDGPDYGEVLEDLYALEVVQLSGRNGMTEPDKLIYDPLSDDYLGGTSVSGSVIYSLDELSDPATMSAEADIVNDHEGQVVLDKVDSTGPQPIVVVDDSAEADDDIDDQSFGEHGESDDGSAVNDVAPDPDPQPQSEEFDTAPVRKPIAPRRQQGV